MAVSSDCDHGPTRDLSEEGYFIVGCQSNAKCGWVQGLNIPLPINEEPNPARRRKRSNGYRKRIRRQR
jgi:hypothetical protein